jgi:hypothetical protein
VTWRGWGAESAQAVVVSAGSQQSRSLQQQQAPEPPAQTSLYASPHHMQVFFTPNNHPDSCHPPQQATTRSNTPCMAFKGSTTHVSWPLNHHPDCLTLHDGQSPLISPPSVQASSLTGLSATLVQQWGVGGVWHGVRWDSSRL